MTFPPLIRVKGSHLIRRRSPRSVAPVFLPRLCPRYYGVSQNMEIVSSLVSLTVAKVLKFSGLDTRNVLKTKRMEEKALEVYGAWVRGPTDGRGPGGFVKALMSADRLLSIGSSPVFPRVCKQIKGHFLQCPA